jgi:hypothetical protein
VKPLTKYYSDDFCQALPWPRKAAVYLASEADARFADLEAERDTARADAERYRWLRNDSGNEHDTPYVRCDGGPHKDDWLVGDQLDEALDAARRNDK